MMAERFEWGWTSYRKTAWRSENGRALYEAHFRTARPIGGGYVHQIRLQFFARRPLIALRVLCSTGRTPTELMAFGRQEVN